MVGKIVLAITLNHKTGFISDKMPDKFRVVVMRTLPTASIFAAKRENMNIKIRDSFRIPYFPFIYTKYFIVLSED